MITLVWAQTSDGVIGKDNKLPWKIKEEMQHFVRYTSHKSILMGRKTWESIGEKPLKNRKNYIATNSQKLVISESDTFVVNDLTAFLEKWTHNDEELVIIGGAKIFEFSIMFANKLVVSIINNGYEGDTYMSNIDYGNFKQISKEDFEEFSVLTYERT